MRSTGLEGKVPRPLGGGPCHARMLQLQPRSQQEAPSGKQQLAG